MMSYRALGWGVLTGVGLVLLIWGLFGPIG